VIKGQRSGIKFGPIKPDTELKKLTSRLFLEKKKKNPGGMEPRSRGVKSEHVGSWAGFGKRI